MGITTRTALWLAALQQQGVDFSSTVALGRQTWIADAPSLHHGLSDLGIESPGEEALRSLDGWSDHYLRWLGADRLSALDTSAYEGADLLANLNEPLSGDLPRFSVVLDGGTLEHVANVFTGFEGAMSLVAADGHILSINPTNGESGHGFYQFSPALYWGLYSRTNGFHVDSMLIDHNGLTRGWYKVRKPQHQSERVAWNRPGVSYLHVVASRRGEPGVVAAPQQGDYQADWELARGKSTEAAPTPDATVSQAADRSLLGRLPRWARTPLLRVARVWRPLPEAFERTNLRSLRL